MKRVAITGLGITSGIGNNLKDFSRNLLNMQSGIREVKIFDTNRYRFNLGSTVEGLESTLPKGTSRMPRPIQFLINATEEAMGNSGLAGSVAPNRVGAYFAGPACSIFETESFYKAYVEKGIWETDPMDLMYANWDSAVNEIGRRFGLMGPRNTVLTACSSSGVAIGLAADLIRMGVVDAMVAGGTDGFSEFTYAGFQSLNSISPYPCRPFDKNRMGLSFGEGAGVLVLEDYDKAVARGAEILAEFAGYGAIGEGYNLTAPHPEGIGYVKTMTRAMKMAGINADQVSYVNTHGTATPINDNVEGKAIRKVFGDYPVLSNSIKSLVGHCMGAAGAVEAVNAVLTLMHQAVPGTKNCEELDPEIGINVAQETREGKIEYVLSNSAGFGGNNSSLLLKRA